MALSGVMLSVACDEDVYVFISKKNFIQTRRAEGGVQIRFVLSLSILHSLSHSRVFIFSCDIRKRFGSLTEDILSNQSAFVRRCGPRRSCEAAAYVCYSHISAPTADIHPVLSDR